MRNTIRTIENIQTASKPYLDALGIAVESLSQWHYEDLSTFLRQRVSSQKFNEFAMSFKELPAHRITLQILEKMLELKGSIYGVEIADNKKLGSFNSWEEYDLTEKVKMVEEKETSRVENFVKHAITLQNQGKGDILLIGMTHYENLLKEFYEKGHLGEVVVLFPHSERCFTKIYEDRELKVSQLKLTKNLPQFIRRLSSIDEIPEFVDALTRLLPPIMTNFNQNLREISPNQEPLICPAAEVLSSTLKIPLVTKRRPSMYVDCFHTLTEQDNELAITAKLNQLGIFSTIKMVDNNRQLIIPCVNSPEVVKLIAK